VPRLLGTPGAIRSRAPRLGEHNQAVLSELGIGDSAYAQLLASGVAHEGEPLLVNGQTE